MNITISENWELESLYPGGCKSGKLAETMERLQSDIQILSAQIARGRTDEEVLNRLQTVMRDCEEVDDFIVCLYAEELDNEDAARLMNENEKLRLQVQSLINHFGEAVGRIPEENWNAFIQSQSAEMQFYLEELRSFSANSLSAENERIIKNLSLDGFMGWNRHHDLLMSEMKISVESEGGFETLSIGQAQSRAMFSDDRLIRQKTGRAILKECEKEANLFASVWNHLAGFRISLYELRGTKNILQEMMDQNRIEQRSLTAMMNVIDQYQHPFKQFLKRKAEISGLEHLAWYDKNATTFKNRRIIAYQDAADIILTQFHMFSNRLGTFAERAFSNKWVEAEDRPGKRSGGFCASMPAAKESRIFLTYGSHYQDVITLAHEFGHAYHNELLHGEPFFAQKKGTGTAETASTFLENFVLDAAVDQAQSKNEKLALLEQKIMSALKYLASIPAMFRMEQAFYEKRKQGWVTADEISSLNLEANAVIFGESVKEENPYQWMTVPHLFHAEIPFYNIPYTIGYLFSNGIYERYKTQGSGFTEQYDELLRHSGRMTMEQLAARYLGDDISQEAFWNEAMQPALRAINEYLTLTE